MSQKQGTRRIPATVALAEITARSLAGKAMITEKAREYPLSHQQTVWQDRSKG